MTDIELKALALLNEVEAERSTPDWEDVCRSSLTSSEALCRAIERHEAFRQEVSDAVEHLLDGPVGLGTASSHLKRFILPKPVDPLVEVLTDISGEGGFDNYDHMAHRLHQALAARGLEIREVE